MKSRIRLWSEGDLRHFDCLEAIVPETTGGGAGASGLCCVHQVAAGPGGCLYWWWCVYWHIQQSVWSRISEEASRGTPVILSPWFCITLHTLNHQQGYFSQSLSSIKFSPLQMAFGAFQGLVLPPRPHWCTTSTESLGGGGVVKLSFVFLCSVVWNVLLVLDLSYWSYSTPSSRFLIRGTVAHRGNWTAKEQTTKCCKLRNDAKKNNNIKQMQEENVQPSCTRPLGGADSPERRVGNPGES